MLLTRSTKVSHHRGRSDGHIKTQEGAHVNTKCHRACPCTIRRVGLRPTGPSLHYHGLNERNLRKPAIRRSSAGRTERGLARCAPMTGHQSGLAHWLAPAVETWASSLTRAVLVREDCAVDKGCASAGGQRAPLSARGSPKPRVLGARGERGAAGQAGEVRAGAEATAARSAQGRHPKGGPWRPKAEQRRGRRGGVRAALWRGAREARVTQCARRSEG